MSNASLSQQWFQPLEKVVGTTIKTNVHKALILGGPTIKNTFPTFLPHSLSLSLHEKIVLPHPSLSLSLVETHLCAPSPSPPCLCPPRPRLPSL